MEHSEIEVRLRLDKEEKKKKQKKNGTTTTKKKSVSSSSLCLMVQWIFEQVRQ